MGIGVFNFAFPSGTKIEWLGIVWVVRKESSKERIYYVVSPLDTRPLNLIAIILRKYFDSDEYTVFDKNS